MLELGLEPSDVATIRFAVSPLHESVISLARLDPADLSALMGATSDAEVLRLLRSPSGWTPDFLTPPPIAPAPTIAAELAHVAVTDPVVVTEDVLTAYSGTGAPLEIRRRLRDPERFLGQIVCALEAYWEAVMASRWPRMKALLQADVVYRAKRLTDGGYERVFADLHDGVRWTEDGLQVETECTELRHAPLAGRGLPLVPSLLAPKLLVNIDAGRSPIVIYPARGGAALLSDTPGWGRALSDLLGRGRARVLCALEEPATTSQLAHSLGLTPASVSHHLGVLQRSGLVDRARRGRWVLYAPTALAEELRVAAGEPAGADQHSMTA